MTRLYRFQQVAALALGLLAFTNSSAYGDTRQMSPAQTLQAAATALKEERPTAALELTRALLHRDPDDISALLIHARAARLLGKYDLSKRTAQHAWQISNDKTVKYSAARLVAQALSAADKRTRAQIWLRRAVQNAPSPRARQIAVQDFGYVRARNPWSTHLRFSISPSNNINNGSANSTSILTDLPFEFTLNGAARALSGLEMSAGLTTRYRFSHTREHATDLSFSLDHRTYQMTSAARALAPTAKGSDFALTNATLSLVQRWTAPDTGTETTVTTAANTSIYGGNHYGITYRATFGQTIPVSRRRKFNWAISGERKLGPRAPHATGINANVGLATVLRTGSVLRFSARATNSASAVSSARYTDFSAGLSLQIAKPILTARTTIGLNLRRRDYPVSYIAAGRHDREIGAYIQMKFTNVDYFGFNPVMTASAARSNSNIGLFDVETFGISVGIQSAF